MKGGESLQPWFVYPRGLKQVQLNVLVLKAGMFLRVLHVIAFQSVSKYFLGVSVSYNSSYNYVKSTPGLFVSGLNVPNNSNSHDVIVVGLHQWLHILTNKLSSHYVKYRSANVTLA